MLINVSHISDKSLFNTVKSSKAPVLDSHSSVWSTAHLNRNTFDEMIGVLEKNVFLKDLVFKLLCSPIQ